MEKIVAKVKEVEMYEGRKVSLFAAKGIDWPTSPDFAL